MQKNKLRMLAVLPQEKSSHIIHSVKNDQQIVWFHLKLVISMITEETGNIIITFSERGKVSREFDWNSRTYSFSEKIYSVMPWFRGITMHFWQLETSFPSETNRGNRLEGTSWQLFPMRSAVSHRIHPQSNCQSLRSSFWSMLLTAHSHYS